MSIMHCRSHNSISTLANDDVLFTDINGMESDMDSTWKGITHPKVNIVVI